MTRINTDLDPKKLTDQHLMAEYRELTMVHGSLRRSLKSKSLSTLLKSIPKQFTLNKGHVTFFYDKLVFLEKRYTNLIAELKIRGFNLDATRLLPNLSEFPPELHNDWASTAKDRTVITERIVFRIRQKPTWYRYYGTPIDAEHFIEEKYQ